MLAKHARHRPDHLAVVFGQHRVGYGDFDRSTNRVANAFAGLGVAKGERIATFLSNSLELLEVYWAAAKIGAVVVPLSPLLRGKGLSTLLRDADVGLVITEEATAPFLDEVRPEVEALRADPRVEQRAGAVVVRAGERQSKPGHGASRGIVIRPWRYWIV